VNTAPTTKQLKLFGLVLSAVIVFWLLVYWYNSEQTLIDLWPYWLLTVLFLIIALFIPLRLKRFYLLWMKAAEWINKVVINLMLSLIFFLLITPIAIIIRSLGHDALRNPRYIEGTYRQPSKPIEAEDMKDPF
jgi:ABC-type uncharacterized transport system permease subunit